MQSDMLVLFVPRVVACTGHWTQAVWLLAFKFGL